MLGILSTKGRGNQGEKLTGGFTEQVITEVLQVRRARLRGNPIIIISNEGYLPIDRPKLSKALLTDLAKLQWRDEDWYKSGSVEIVKEEVVAVDFASKTVSTKSGGKFAYSKLVLSTGGTPRVLPLQGFKVLGNIFTLRNVHDAKKIVDAIGITGEAWFFVLFLGSSASSHRSGSHGQIGLLVLEPKPTSYPELGKAHRLSWL
ncbi:hypothetical protein B0T16DRAFT_384264 [Cercophora newfieldiana]|uniref:FAD/NAD(P)-binding domain-containing protein n=1 Tax=Cercophora newfieldiana TaxID=92897 RepID=A0AA40CXN5_9PEZI|nr:hypothetical protein B0T16DRAFT_384264 [Cercophora newfieldiana]